MAFFWNCIAKAAIRRTPPKTPLCDTSDETKILSVLSAFLLGEVSVRRFDTVTLIKSNYCKKMRGRIHSCYIDVTGVTLADRTQFLAEVERLVNSHTLHGSESLCKLLRYLAKQSADHPGVPVKEYQIATEVFGRQADFDPQLDSMVRVQAGRLRSKLAEYYSSEGTNDTTVIEVPKGSYAVVFHDRTQATHTNGLPESASLEANHSAIPRGWMFAVVGLSLALVAAIALLARGYASTRNGKGSSLDAAEAPAPFRIFWKGFITGPEEPWVIFSNAAFVGRPETGMRYYDAARDGSAPILDHYTGVGEVLAIHNLDLVFGSLHQSLRVKRGSLFSLDDAKNNDLIFIGSPSENLTLRDIPSTKEFVFARVPSGPHAGNLEIIATHPQPGERKEFLPTPPLIPVTEDFAIIALVRGINPEHSELILAGNSTLGTQAAVEFVTRENYLATLLQSLGVGDSSQLKPFEALIQVRVAKGVPVESSLVAVRKLQ